MAAKRKRSSSDKQGKATVKSLTAKLERSDAKAARWKKDQKQLKATVKSLTAKLERSDAKAARWRKEAERHKAAAAASQARVAKLDKKLTSARRTASQATPTKGVELATTAQVGAHEDAVSTMEPTGLPDASWTVARLREEASSRGLTGLSGKNKAQLIAALT